MVRIHAIDLFCGAGGLTRGLLDAEIDVVAGIDIDPQSEYPYKHNNDVDFILKDVHDVTGAEIDSVFGNARIRLLAGCAPCQPFSTYSRSTKRQRDHQDWGLLREFGRLIQETQPELVTMENVPSLEHQPVFDAFLSALDGYNIWCEVIELDKIGVPQTRKRLVLIASRLGDVSFSAPYDVQTVQDAIGSLPRPEDSDDPLHTASQLSHLNLQRIRASRPGGTWRDWPEHLRAACHRRVSGSTYPSVYGRMEWGKPGPTITTQCYAYGSGRFGHPEQDRAITLREAALLQTFPPRYEFGPPDQKITFSGMGRVIGNAVPVQLGKAIGESIKAHVTINT